MSGLRDHRRIILYNKGNTEKVSYHKKLLVGIRIFDLAMWLLGQSLVRLECDKERKGSKWGRGQRTMELRPK